jgi:DNA-binding GntR family transcriptional regulator
MPWFTTFGAADRATLKRIENKLDAQAAKLAKMETEIMSALDDAFTQAEAAAKANSDAEDSVETLLTTLSAQIAALKTSGTDPATVTRINALTTALNAKAAGLAAAVVANTPAAPAP